MEFSTDLSDKFILPPNVRIEFFFFSFFFPQFHTFQYVYGYFSNPTPSKDILGIS